MGASVNTIKADAMVVAGAVEEEQDRLSDAAT